MFGAEARALFIQVITSWQVLTVTFVIILYFFLVSYVARLHHRRPRKAPLPKKKKEKVQTDDSIIDDSDELGLEEQSQ